MAVFALFGSAVGAPGPLALRSVRMALELASIAIQRSRGELALRESEEKFRSLAENLNDVVWLAEPDGSRIHFVNAAYERVWGKTCESLYRSPRSFLDSVHPEDRSKVEAQLPGHALGQWDIEYRIVRPDGSIRWVHDRGAPIREANGTIRRVAGFAVDITERKQLQANYDQAQKLEAIGQLAGGVAHDFNNILAATMMQINLVQMRPGLDGELRDSMAELMANAERAASLTRQLLMFSRRSVPQMQTLDLNDTVENLLKMLRRIIGEDIDLDWRRISNLPPIVADAGMLDQVIMNLVVNARDAMPKGGSIGISASDIQVSEEQAASNPEARPGRFVCLAISDTGCGMSEEVLKRVFEPFFTTKETGRGTGLGLATVYGIAKQHHGWVEIETKVDHGSTFKIFLPATVEPVHRAAITPAPSRLPGGHETILWVEDDPALRKVTANLLRRCGYEVLEAADALQAMEIWELNSSRIALLASDMVMPKGLNGLQLAEKLRAGAPELKVMICSGYSRDLVHLNKQDIVFLAKPASTAALAAAVRRCLDGRKEAR